ncbi:transcriptional regulator PadR-like family protein [Halalkalicoccus paucihalophilus]|uniref:Transcriptional regulator PadR-like family protein n=1 Tax=Halalkalicoccus paucihalophilus TaxID=1008153 RepID=A0A151ABL2_9EURY|nr:PadR family transcriptional regulator [Halalkalicoccus paucihalophilus]KYH25025.1 transcriptional regulator PadR-like family protein [Halalkalicoccus paucihalophilus]
MNDLTGFQRDLLYIIAGCDETYEFKIKDELESYYQTEITHDRLYPNLDTLVNAELLETRQHNNQPDEYVMTVEGQNEVETRRRWENNYLESDSSV